MVARNPYLDVAHFDITNGMQRTEDRLEVW